MLNSGVYLLECPYDGVTMLKIGFSKDVVKRLKQHKTSNPYIVPLGYIKSSDYKFLEKQIHTKCRNYKLKEEWFLNKQEIKDYFYEHKDFKKY